MKLVLGGLVSAVCLWLAVRGIEWSQMADAFARTRPIPLLLATVVGFAGACARAWRWHYILAPIKAVPGWRLVSPTLIGGLANNVLPARLGEVVRAHVLGKTEGVSRIAVLGTIVYERIVDVFATLLVLALALVFVPGPEWLRSGGLLLLAANTLLLAVVVAMVVRRSAFVALLTRLLDRFIPTRREAVVRVVDSTLDGLQVAAHLPSVLPIALSSIVIMAGSVLPVWFALDALDIDVAWHAALTATAFISLGSMLPAAPGNVGPIQYACVLALALYGIPQGDAAAFSFAYHATQYLPVTLVGALLFWRQQYTWSELTETS